jgi:hypothetical protein
MRINDELLDVLGDIYRSLCRGGEVVASESGMVPFDKFLSLIINARSRRLGAHDWRELIRILDAGILACERRGIR